MFIDSIKEGILLLSRFYFHGKNKNCSKVLFGHEIEVTFVWANDLLANEQAETYSVIALDVKLGLFAVDSLSRLEIT